MVYAECVILSTLPAVHAYNNEVHYSSSQSFVEQSMHNPHSLHIFSKYCSHVSHCDGPYGALILHHHSLSKGIVCAVQ